MKKRLFIRGFLVYFLVCFFLLIFIGFWRITLFNAGNVFVGTDFEHLAKITFTEMSFVSFYVSLCLGVLSSFLDVFVFRAYFKKLSFGVSLLLGILIEVMVVWVILYYSNIFFVNYLFKIEGSISMSLGEIPDIQFISIYLLLIVALCHLLLEIDQKLGRGNLWKFITGRFYKPRTENRIFMFLDLRASTKIAEKIGHLRFSTLLQDCFNDLAVVDNYYARVYQYVGDEVILSWNAEKGIRKNNFLHAFFAFRDKLESKRDYYQKKYGFFPEFKAGAHIGECTVSELGDLKREIAYSGDTLNTTARIESMCNQLESDFLISEKLKNSLNENIQFSFVEKGCVGLKGKSNKINLFNVELI